MDFVKYFDFFGIKFHFYTNNQPNYRNIFGGVVNLIYLMICGMLFVFVSCDGLKMINPNTAMSGVAEKEARIVDLNNEKIWIPFRLVNWENQFIKHRGIVTIKPYYIEGKFDEVHSMVLKYHLLNYTLCNETIMANKPENYRINVPLNELYCIEQEGVLFGGHWNSQFLNYIEIKVFLCDENILFNSSDPRCKKTDDLLKSQNSSIIFDFYYPVVQFQPRNLETPIAIIYKNFYYRISTFSRKLEKVFIREHILSDDKNMITTNYKNSSIWGASLIYSDDYSLVTGFDPIANTESKEAYSLDIFMDNGFIYYTRSYKKMFLIISNVFPIFKLLLYFFKKFTQHMKMSSTKRKLAGLIFEKKSIISPNFFPGKIANINNNNKIPNEMFFSTPKLKNRINNKNKKDEIIKCISNKLNQFYPNSNKEIILENSVDFMNNIKGVKLEDKNKSNISLKEKNPMQFLNKKELILFRKNVNLGVSLFQKKENPMKAKKSKQKDEEYIFPYFYFFLDFFLDKLIYPQKFFCLHPSYFTVYNFMCRIYDISTHLILFKHFNLLNKLVKKMQEKEENCQHKIFNKINISDKRIVDRINCDLKSRKSILFSNNLV